MKPNLLTFLHQGFAQVQKYGLELLYWRYIYRLIVLTKSPITCPPDSKLEVHLQICRRDWLNGLWTLRSFSIFSQQPFRLVLLHDGWLDNESYVVHSYLKQFPGVITYKRSSLLSRVKTEIHPESPSLARLWEDGSYFTLPKVIDSFLLSTNQCYLQLDPDVLFFDYPYDLLMSLTQLNDQSSCWNLPNDKGHADGLFCFTPEEIAICGYQVPVPFGTGLGSVNKTKFDWNLADQVFSTLSIPATLKFMVDQTFFALMAAKHGFIPLPKQKYAVDPVTSLEGIVARHYYGKTRDLMYIEGLKKLSQVKK